MNKKRHVVLIDDDVITRKLHQSLICRQHSEMGIASFDNPSEALDYIINDPPDLIFLDLHMPLIDGFQFLEMLDSRQICVDVFIISSSSDPIEISKARAYGFVKEFVPKPLTHEKVSRIFNS